MVRVERFAKWFCITNDKGGYGSFVLTINDHGVWVWDVNGNNIIDDIYSYTREVGRQLGLNTYASIENKRLVTWIEHKVLHDPTVSYDYDRMVLTMVN